MKFCLNPPRNKTRQLNITNSYNFLKEKASPILFLHGLYLPQNIRPVYYAIGNLEMEMQKISQDQNNQNLSLGKLDFWRESIEDLFNKKYTSNEPTLHVLADYLKNQQLPKKPFIEYFNAIENEIQNLQTNTISELVDRIRQKKQMKFLLLTSLLNVQINTDENLEFFKVLENFSIAEGMLIYVLQTPYHLQKQQQIFPLEVCNHFNFNIKNLWDRQKGKPREEYYDAVLEYYKKTQFYRQ